jgi:uncharacterized membrane protein YedE/YeeE
MIGLIAAFVAGALFAVGLGVGGMTQPARVLAFLDVAGSWDPSLAFVMAGAVGVYAAAFRLIRRRQRPVLSDAFAIPATRDVDVRLLAGAALFGIGWGLAGYCPGPGIVSLVTGRAEVLVFVIAMLAGMGIADTIGTWSLMRTRTGDTLSTQEGR